MSEVQFPTVKERVYEKLLGLIVAGDIPLNSQLDERALAEQLSVSRTPLREAIGTLAKEGLVEYRRYRGNFVRSYTAKQVGDLYEVRKVLEALAVRRAVPQLSDESLEELVGILHDVDAALDVGDREAFSAADTRFHETIARLSGNQILIESLKRLGLQIRIMRNIANADPDVVERTSHERPKIVAAFRSRNAELAARLMEEHIEGVRRAVVAQLEAYELKAEGGREAVEGR